MPISQQTKTVLKNVLGTLPSETRQELNGESTPGLLATFAEIIGEERIAGMQQALTAAVSTADVITDWTVFDTARQFADGATVLTTLSEVRAALDAHENSQLNVKAFAFILAALKHFPA